MLFVMVSCTTRPMPEEEKEYPEALFRLGEISTVELEMPEATWQTLIKKASDKDYYECAVTINGERFDNVAIRTKGASSLDDVQLMKSDRYSFTLKLNKYEKGQDYHGLSKLLLNNNIWDATQMKEAITEGNAVELVDLGRFTPSISSEGAVGISQSSAMTYVLHLSFPEYG